MRTLHFFVAVSIGLVIAQPPMKAGQSGKSGTHGPPPQAQVHGGQPKSHSTGPTSHPTDPKTNHGSPKSATTSQATTASTQTAITTRIESHPQLAARLRTLLQLPPNTSLSPYVDGFRNQGQFIAAVHVANNLGIPFAQLKTQMVTNGLSLGQSIQTLKPSANAKTEVERGESEANEDEKN